MKSKTFSLVLKTDDYNYLKMLATSNQTSVSSIARRLILTQVAVIKSKNTEN